MGGKGETKIEVKNEEIWQGLQTPFATKSNDLPLEEAKVHFVCTGPDFPYAYYIGVMTAWKAHGDAVALWLVHDLSGNKYIELLKDRVNIKQVPTVPKFPALSGCDDYFLYMAIFDYLIWNIVYKHGGMIMGLDSITLKPHFDLLESNKQLMAPINNDKVQPYWYSMHGAIVRKGSAIAKAIITDAEAALSNSPGAIRWGDVGITPFNKHVRKQIGNVSTAAFGVCGGRLNHDGEDFYLLKQDGQLLADDVRTIPLYSSSTKLGKKLTSSFVRDNDTLYSRLVKRMLTEEEWSPLLRKTRLPEPKYLPMIVKRKKRFHLLGLPHLVTNKKEALACAFSQKVIKMAMMLKSLDHTVFFYGVEGSDGVECDEFIQVSTKDILRQAYGDYDYYKQDYKHNPHDIAYKTFNLNAIREINKRKEPTDFLLIPFSPAGYRAIINAFQTSAINDDDRLYLIVEMGIGYRFPLCAFKVFESYSQLHYVWGLQGLPDGRWYDVVIPNYFDERDFRYSAEKKDYFLYLGRIIHRKGIGIAVTTVAAIDGKLIVAGQDGGENVNLSGSHVEYIGFADWEKRRELLAGAKGLFLPTKYIEPFGGVIIEAAFSGTPVITTDWGAFPELVIHGKTGFRCRTLDQFVWAARNIATIQPSDCRDYAMSNFSLDRVRWMYEEYFDMLLDIKLNVGGKAWKRIHPERSQLDWLKRRY